MKHAFAPLLLGLAICSCSGDDRPGALVEADEGGGTSGWTSPDPQGGSGGSGSAAHRYKVGDTLPETLRWQGLAAGSVELTTLSLADFYDPTGAKGINALLITEGSPNCAPCTAEAKDLPGRLQGQWGKLGVQVVQLLVDNGNLGPATLTSALQWQKKANASWPIGIDPDFTFAQTGSNPFPIQVVIDPRTLKIVARISGYQSQLPEVDQLAESNL